MNEVKILAKVINDSKLLISKEINTFLYCLFLRIFLRKRKKSISKKVEEKLKIFIDKINKEIIKDKDKEINEEYTIKNLINIIDFVKSQNILFSSEIIENILIIIFSFAFKTDKRNSFSKLLYNNMDLIKRLRNSDWINWLLLNKFNEQLPGKEAENFKILLENDFSVKNMNKFSDQAISFFLLNINNNKLEILNNEEKTKNKNLADTTTTDSKKSLPYSSFKSDYLFKGKIGKVSKIPISLFKALLISVYIYYQNKKSPLMEYIHESFTDAKLCIIPFEYNLSEAVIDSDHSSIIFSPIRIEPRIENVKMSKNILKETSLLEFSKALLFNKNIKKIDFHTTILKSSCIY